MAIVLKTNKQKKNCNGTTAEEHKVFRLQHFVQLLGVVSGVPRVACVIFIK